MTDSAHRGQSFDEAQILMDGDGGHGPIGGRRSIPLGCYHTALLVPVHPNETPVDTEGSSLHCAASQGRVDAINRLFSGTTRHSNRKRSVSCDAVDRNGKTALHWCSQHGHKAVVQQLLSAGATVDPTSPAVNHPTPLMLAALAGHIDVVRILLAAGAGSRDRHERDGIKYDPLSCPWRSTALHYAAAGGHVEIASVLLDVGFDKHQRDGAGLSPAEVAARSSSMSVFPTSSDKARRAATTCRLLPKDRGASIVHAYVNMIAEDNQMVRGLAEGGACLDWQDDIGDSPLHLAAHYGHVRITQTLLEAGAETGLRNHRGASPLHVAASKGSVPIVSMLLEAGADTESRMVNGRSALHLAVINDKPKVVKILLKANVYLEHRDHVHGQTPLSEAAEYGLAHIIRMLLETREEMSTADVETRSSAGLTPLHWACRFNSPDSVRVLLSAGADPDAVDFAAAAVIACGFDSSTATSSTLITNERCSQSTRPSYSSKLGCYLLDSSATSCFDRSLPTAADVIGLGNPCRWREDPNREFNGELPLVSNRRRNSTSSRRIRVLLHRARKDKAWRRRGWLVILAKRLETKNAEVGSKRGYFVDMHVDASTSSIDETIDDETELGQEDQAAVSGVKGFTNSMHRGAKGEMPEEMGWRGDVEGDAAFDEGSGSGSCARPGRELFLFTSTQDVLRREQGVSRAKNGHVCSVIGAKRPHDDLPSAFDGCSGDESSSVTRSCTAAVVERSLAYSESTSRVMCNRRGRYGDIAEDGMEVFKEKDGELQGADVYNCGEALKTDDDSDGRMVGPDMIERVVGLSCVEMGVFRRIVYLL